MECPKCKREWDDECQQAECVRRHGECICCRFLPVGASDNKHGSGCGTREEFDALAEYLPPNAVFSGAAAKG